ncbi:uncharacterized protein LOC127283561 isoform X2 [Leptopilina boulardi]|nr:uncharacterized protein LOC127283561 isoform X2 [Leptopilina boulardi]
MHLLVPILLNCLHVLRIVLGQELSVTRHADGDIFTIEGSCSKACKILSSGTATPLFRNPSNVRLYAPVSSCSCQCNVEVPVFREDLHICVNDIHECNAAGFMNRSGIIERVPYIYLPQRGQIIYPQAEIHFEGVKFPVCGITGAQQLGKGGWIELRNLSSSEPPFRLFRDEGRTFLQWIGETGLREATEGKLVVAKLICRDAFPRSTHPQVFTPCVAFRVSGSSSKNSVREVTFSSNFNKSQGLSTIEYTAIGISSILLALIYVASVSLYLHSRKSRRKSLETPEVIITSGRDGVGLVKNNPLLAASRHFENDSALSESDLGDDLPQSDGDQGFENVHVTSALVHPHFDCLEINEGICGSGTILGEILPEEDVRIVETVDNTHNQDTPVLPGAQRRKLYFNPAYFDRQLLLAPPPAAIEFLLKIREVIAIAKHKMSAKKFVPSLGNIPEEDNLSEQCSLLIKQKPNFTRNSIVKSQKSQNCSGCPGCLEYHSNLPTLAENIKQIPGESRVRAWLEDVKPPERRWKENENEGKFIKEKSKIFTNNLEYLEEITNKYEFKSNLSSQFFSTWRDNPPMLKTFRNIARSEYLDNDDKFSISQRSTKSMFEEPIFDRFQRKLRDGFDLHENNEINAKVRKAIENSFIKQMEENTILEKKEKKFIEKKNETLIGNNDLLKKNDNEKSIIPPYKKSRKPKAPSVPKKLPNMIKEISNIPNGTNTAKRIMDAVIKEMVDVKSLETCTKSSKIDDYEVDSLERSKYNRKSSTSPESIDHSSPSLSSALPMEEELTMQNAIINRKTGEMTISKMKKSNYYNLPEIVNKKEEYALVSEVYVNDGYTSPTGSDDSGPEIQYEAENPGHLTIKVQDSSKNYIKLDESEYEPDTLDRKPMKLKINGDVQYEKDSMTNEIFADSLERPNQILLRSKGSFKDEDSIKSGIAPLHRGYGSLRAIYEARLKAGMKENSVNDGEKTLSWKKNKYLTPDNRHARRQRKPHQNQPDVVPMPPEEIYQYPKAPRRVENNLSLSKNDWDRSRTKTEDPTASDGAPVPNLNSLFVGITHSENYNNFIDTSSSSYISNINCNGETLENNLSHSAANISEIMLDELSLKKIQGDKNIIDINNCLPSLYGSEMSMTKGRPSSRNQRNDQINLIPTRMRNLAYSADRVYSKSSNVLRKTKAQKKALYINPALYKMEDSGYLSSTDSNGSRKQLLANDVSSVSETDETESQGDGASESGAESVGTDSVFFGNFRKLSETSNFSKSIDSGVDVEVRNPFFKPFGIRNEGGVLERITINTSESEAESFNTVLSPDSSKRSRNLAS